MANQPRVYNPDRRNSVNPPTSTYREIRGSRGQNPNSLSQFTIGGLRPIHLSQFGGNRTLPAISTIDAAFLGRADIEKQACYCKWLCCCCTDNLSMIFCISIYLFISTFFVLMNLLLGKQYLIIVMLRVTVQVTAALCGFFGKLYESWKLLVTCGCFIVVMIICCVVYVIMVIVNSRSTRVTSSGILLIVYCELTDMIDVGLGVFAILAIVRVVRQMREIDEEDY